MNINQFFVIVFCIIVLLAFTTFNSRRAIYTWILLAGALGIPILTVRQSYLMFSELLLALLLLLWFMKKTLNLGAFRLSKLSKMKLNIENSMWAMIAAFMLSFVLNIIFKDTSVGGDHVFIMGKVMGSFLYVASVMAALLIADSIRSFKDVRRICFLLIILGIFTFIIENLKDDSFLGFLRVLQEGVGWKWMNITILFAFSLAYLAFYPQITKKLYNIIISLLIAVHIFSAYFLGIATYKAIIIANFVLMFTIYYYRSRLMAFLAFFISIIIFVGTLSIFHHYVEQESKEGSWGWRSSGRPVIWYHSFLIYLEKPIFGVGPYNYYDYSLYVAKKRQLNDERWGVMTSPHSQYLQILAETGVVGTLAFLWFMTELFRLLKYFLKHNFDYKTKIVASATAAILVSRITVGIIGDYVIPQYHNGGLQNFCSTVYFWICLGVLIGLKKIAVLEENKRKDKSL